MVHDLCISEHHPNSRTKRLFDQDECPWYEVAVVPNALYLHTKLPRVVHMLASAKDVASRRLLLLIGGFILAEGRRYSMKHPSLLDGS